MTTGFLVGLLIGFATAWFIYWRVVKLLAKVGISKSSIRGDFFGKTSYAALLRLREELETEIANRQPPNTSNSPSRDEA